MFVRIQFLSAAHFLSAQPFELLLRKASKKHTYLTKRLQKQ